MSEADPVTSREVGRLRQLAVNALVKGCVETTGAHLDVDNRAERIEQAVVPTVGADELRLAAIDISGGDGGELRATDGRRPSFHSAYSSCAVAVSVFGPWRLDPSTLALFGTRSFNSLRFEARLPITDVRGRPPNLDLIAETRRDVVAVESKLTEYFTNQKIAKFRDPYSAAVKRLAHRSWAKQFDRLRARPDEFRFFDAAQMIKHYLGLKSSYATRRVKLAYLFWEPTDAAAHPLFAQHRAEVARFAAPLDDPELEFVFCSYPELWQTWKTRTPPLLPYHIAALGDRYSRPLEAEATRR